VPVVLNEGIGDSGDVVRDGRVGVVLADTDRATCDEAAGRVDALLTDPEMRARCREVAIRQFSLDEGVVRYASVYEQLS
jgi:glycosyltransferase involved in cell wall biosynthesis